MKKVKIDYFVVAGEGDESDEKALEQLEELLNDTIPWIPLNIAKVTDFAANPKRTRLSCWAYKVVEE